jgi:phenylpropionate dioxygenase-like ring-hydroxylating dioxygenase large terminal subunit
VTHKVCTDTQEWQRPAKEQVMQRGPLIELTRRAVKLAQNKATDLAPAESRVSADAYTSPDRLTLDKAMLIASPQLVGYASELPKPGSYCTKTVMGRSILLTRTSDGTVNAFDNICLHRQSQVAAGCGTARRIACPYHAWTYDLDGRLVGVPGKDGFPGMLSAPRRLAGLPAAEYAGFLWVSLDAHIPLDVAAHLGPLGPELESWGIGRWSPLGEKVLDCPINWKLAIDTFSENYHFATVHKTTFATIARSNCTVFDSFGAHHRLVFPLNGILDLETKPEDQWDPLQSMVVIYALFPNIVLSVTIANGELFRVYPTDEPGRSITVHQNSTPLDLSDESAAAGAQAVFDYAHGTVRDEDYRLVAGLQANLESGAKKELVFGRNEPGLQHRHTSWFQAIGAD